MTFEEMRRYRYQHIAVSLGEQRIEEMVYSDISAHLPVIEYYASLSKVCVELGVRDGFSTLALCAGCKGSVISVDIEHTPFVNNFATVEKPCYWKYICGSSIDPFIGLPEQYDLLFLDTKHTRDHLRRELELWGRKARFLVFHDSETCKDTDRSGPDPSMIGIGPAISEWRHKYNDYITVYETTRNNGLLVLEKIPIAMPVDELPTHDNIAACQAESNA